VSQLRVGVVGAGIMGRTHATILASHPEAKVTAVASGSRSNADRLAAEVGATAYDSYAEMFASGEVDLVAVATPDHLHADVVVAAAEAGIHVVCEKPFTTDIADADRALQAVRSAGVTGMVLFNHRWIPAYAQAKSLIDAGQIGPIQIGYARKNDRIYVPTQMIGWAAETTPAWFLSSHDIDLVGWFMDDEAIEVFATATGGVLSGRGIDCPDAVVSQVRYRGGAVVTYEASWVLPNTFPTMTDSFVQVIGEAGVLRLDRIHEQIELTTAEEFHYPRNQLVNTLHGVPGGAVRGALFHVVDCVLSGSEPLVTLESSRHVTAVLAAIHRSLITGGPVSVTPANDESGTR